MGVKFELTGLDSLDVLAKEIKNEYTKQVDLGTRHGINKSIDMIAYGQLNNIKPTNVKADSAVGAAAKKLRIPVEHLFYRTFTRNIKVSAGGKGIKPYASVMMRANTINVVDLLLKGNVAKNKYGFTSRKRKTGAKTKVNMKSYAESARIGGRRSGVVKIAGVAYNNAYIEDGSYRAKYNLDEHYIKNLGADPSRKGLAGAKFLVFQKKSKGQKLPYPSKAVKLKHLEVKAALTSGAKMAISRYSNKLEQIQANEIKKRLKRFGFE